MKLKSGLSTVTKIGLSTSALVKDDIFFSIRLKLYFLLYTVLPHSIIYKKKLRYRLKLSARSNNRILNRAMKTKGDWVFLYVVEKSGHYYFCHYSAIPGIIWTTT